MRRTRHVVAAVSAAVAFVFFASTDAARAAEPGYWVVSTEGRVRAFGGAADHGDTAGDVPDPNAAMAATPTGKG